jgi:hypothetical protein
MRRRRRTIRRWLALAATLATLGIAATASAMPGGDGAGARDHYSQGAVAAGDGAGSSTWWYVVIAAVVVFGLTLAGAAIIRRSDQRRRLAGLAH